MEKRTAIAGLLAALSLIVFTYFSFSSEAVLFAQQQGTISIDRATALPLINAEGNQVKVIINYSIGDQSVVGQRINAVMGIYDRPTGSLIKLSSFPNGVILNNTEGAIYLASTLTDPKIQNITTLVTLTNADRSEKYSNEVRADLDMRTVLPTSITALNETSAPPPSSAMSTGDNVEETPSTLPAAPPPPSAGGTEGNEEDIPSNNDESN
jgi:hypothetical protein